jgi:hypothetical protein
MDAPTSSTARRRHRSLDTGGRQRRRLGVLVVAAGLLLGFTATARAADVSSSSSADPVAENPVSLTVTGTADLSSYLYVFVATADTACAPTHGQQRGDTAANRAIYPSRPVSDEFSESYSFTPAAAGGYVICSYVSDTASVDDTSSDEATSISSFSARAPHPPTLSLSLAAGNPFGLPVVGIGQRAGSDPADPWLPLEQLATMTITASGTTEVGRALDVLINDTQPCAAADDQEFDWAWANPAGRDLPVKGGFSSSFAETPSFWSDYWICAYVIKPRTATSLSESTLAAASQHIVIGAPPPRHLTRLRTHISSQTGHSAKHPGLTLIKAQTTANAAAVSVTIKRGHRRLKKWSVPRVDELPPDEDYPDVKAGHIGGNPEHNSFQYNWKCDRGGRTTFTITAKDAYGKTLTKRKTVRLPSCKHVVEAHRRRVLERRREAKREAKREARFRQKCRKSGGVVANADGTERCVHLGVILFVIVL